MASVELRNPALERMRAGDVISILSWGLMHDGQTLNHTALIVTLDGANGVIAVQSR